MRILVDEKIFRVPDNLISGFNRIPYIFNINHPVINALWEKYIKQSGTPKQYLPSEKHRKHFESQVIRMIENRKIIVQIKDEKAYIPPFMEKEGEEFENDISGNVGKKLSKKIETNA